jgi:hypothetical protein
MLDVGCWVFPVGLSVCLLTPSALGGIESTPTAALQSPKQLQKEAPALAVPETVPPASPREFFNAGTRQLSAGKLREAEASLETALVSQDQRLQPSALYNLGIVRFRQGLEELKKGPTAKPTVARGQSATQQGDEALRQAEGALASDDMLKMVAAYMRGRGARKELKGATEAVQRALKAHGTTLARWERSSGDLKSTLELNSADSDARYNAEVVDRCIAKLVDSIQELQQCSSGTCNKNNQLSDALKKLKGRIPNPNMPPGEAGDEEEEQDQKPQSAQQEGPSKDGQEMTLSPEQAAWLLDSYRLDSERRLPMGETPGQPKERSRSTW